MFFPNYSILRIETETPHYDLSGLVRLKELNFLPDKSVEVDSGQNAAVDHTQKPLWENSANPR